MVLTGEVLDRFQKYKKECDLSNIHYGKDAIEHDWGITEEHDHSFYFFIPEYEPKYLSGIVVTSLAGHFIKVSMTFFDDPVYRIFSGEFTTELLNLVRRSKSAGMAPKE